MKVNPHIIEHRHRHRNHYQILRLNENKAYLFINSCLNLNIS
jgi:hypothetical protein